MSKLHTLRLAVRDLLLEGGLWTTEEVIVDRRTDFWNKVAVAVQSSEQGQCIQIAVAEGDPSPRQRPQAKSIYTDITLALNIIELPKTEEPLEATELTDEDARWEATMLRLVGNPLGRSDLHYDLTFTGFKEVEDEQYLIRQTTFRTALKIEP